MSEQRNAEADLAVCAAATPGPWVVLDSRRHPGDFDWPNAALPGVVAQWQILGGGANEEDTREYGYSVIHGEAHEGEIVPEDADLDFVAAAREALPWWIQEAQVRQVIIDGYSQAIDDQHAEIERLTAENARLKQIISNMEENL